MAGDWIPMRVDLHDDPAVIAIAGETGLDEFAVVGRLHRLWSWANRQLTSGVAPSITDSWVDRHVNTPGFAAAMLKAGWLRLRSGHLEFPNFDRWNSQGAKKRLEKTQRKQVERSRKSATDVAKVSPISGDKKATREEKRREEKRSGEVSPETPLSPSAIPATVDPADSARSPPDAKP